MPFHTFLGKTQRSNVDGEGEASTTMKQQLGDEEKSSKLSKLFNPKTKIDHHLLHTPIRIRDQFFSDNQFASDCQFPSENQIRLPLEEKLPARIKNNEKLQR